MFELPERSETQGTPILESLDAFDLFLVSARDGLLALTTDFHVISEDFQDAVYRLDPRNPGHATTASEVWMFFNRGLEALK